MGWTFYKPRYFKKIGNSWAVDRQKELIDLISAFGDKFELVQGSLRGNVYYAAIRFKPENRVDGWVILTAMKDGMFGYKEMTETSHPFYYDCPKSILKLLSPTTNEEALEWRNGCIEQACLKKSGRKMSSLPVGTVVKIQFCGKDTLVKKMAPDYQFSRNWWLIIGQNKYLSKPYRFDDRFEIVEQG